MSDILSQGTVTSKISNHIGYIEFHHPLSNSLPGALLDAIASEISSLGHNPDVRVIVLKSSGEKAFCSGASFDELISIDSEERGLIFFSGFAKVINAVRKIDKFVIARIHGKAVGGGVGIAAAADYTLALDTASVKLSELAVGIGPFVVGPAVERKIGKADFMELAIDATNWRTAKWASDKGLYSEIFSTIEDLDQGVERMASTLAKSSPEAMADLKRIFWEGTENWDQLLTDRAKISGRLVLSDFTKDFIKNFKNKK